MHQPSEHDYHCLKRILRYIFGTLGRGLLIRPGDLELRGFSDSDWASDKNDRKSTSGFLVFLGPNLISWCTKKQPKVSRSSAEAEYRAIALLAAEIMWVTYILRELRHSHCSCSLLWQQINHLCGQEFCPTHQNEACWYRLSLCSWWSSGRHHDCAVCTHWRTTGWYSHQASPEPTTWLPQFQASVRFRSA